MNDSFCGFLENYLVMTSYSERLAAAMDHAGVKAAALARALGLSYQGVKKVMDGRSNSFSAANNAAAAVFLGVNSDWLAAGKGSMLEPAQPNKVSTPGNQDASGLSAVAIELARLFDLLPNDRIIRARANNAASEAILRILQEQPADEPTPRPDQSIPESPKTRIA